MDSLFQRLLDGGVMVATKKVGNVYMEQIELADIFYLERALGCYLACNRVGAPRGLGFSSPGPRFVVLRERGLITTMNFTLSKTRACGVQDCNP